MNRISELDRKEIKKIINDFCLLAHIESEFFLSDSRLDKLPLIRYIFCYCIKTTFKETRLSELGYLIYKNHSTIIYGLKQIEEELSKKKPDEDIIELVLSFGEYLNIYKLDLMK